MSIATQIQEITDNRNTIRAWGVSAGVAGETDNLATLATKISGISIFNNVAEELKEGQTYTIPKGYHTGTGTVTGVPGGGNYSLQEKSVTPGSLSQTVTPDSGYYGLSQVTVAPIPDSYQDVTDGNAQPAEVVSGKVFFNAQGRQTGTMANNGALSLSFNALTQTSVDIPAGYTSGGSVTLSGELAAALAAI